MGYFKKLTASFQIHRLLFLDQTGKSKFVDIHRYQQKSVKLIFTKSVNPLTILQVLLSFMDNYALKVYIKDSEPQILQMTFLIRKT